MIKIVVSEVMVDIKDMNGAIFPPNNLNSEREKPKKHPKKNSK